jgi:hypothetical protein
LKRDDGLPTSDRGLSRKSEGQPREAKGQPGRNVFKRRLDKLDTKDLEANQQESEAVVVHQEVSNDEVSVETIGTLKD